MAKKARSRRRGLALDDVAAGRHDRGGHLSREAATCSAPARGPQRAAADNASGVISRSAKGAEGTAADTRRAACSPPLTDCRPRDGR